MSQSTTDALQLGEAAWGAYEFEEALAQAERALAADPDSLEALDLKANALAELGRYEEADEAFDAMIERAPGDATLLLAAADVRIRQPGDDMDRIEAGLSLLARAEKAVRKDPELKVEFDLLQGLAANQSGDLVAALRAFDAVLAADDEHAEARLERALALFELRRFDEARSALDALLEDYPDEAWAWHTLGLIEERRGGPAERAFAKARHLAPEEFPAPPRLSAEAFDHAVAEAIAALPEHARPHLANVVIAAERLPTDEDLAALDLSPTLLGLFRGQPIDERSPVEASHHETARITLYQNNLERFCATREELLEQIGITVLHEVGHLLGLDEDELTERGLD